jgi:very-short-patch-repair endonuclease
MHPTEEAMSAKPIAHGGYLDVLSRHFRRGMGRAEALLWSELKGRRLLGYRFERKRQVDRYVVDFYSQELHLAVDVIGVDAPWHGRCVEVERTIRLRLCGVTFLPFGEEEVLYNLDGVVARIRQSIRSRPWR